MVTVLDEGQPPVEYQGRGLLLFGLAEQVTSGSRAESTAFRLAGWRPGWLRLGGR